MRSVIIERALLENLERGCIDHLKARIIMLDCRELSVLFCAIILDLQYSIHRCLILENDMSMQKQTNKLLIMPKNYSQIKREQKYQ
jgi:hypothetical protein